MVDLFLSPPYGVPGYQASPIAFDAIVAAKKQLAQAISEGVNPIFTEATGSLPQAQEAIKQGLLFSLSDGYDIDAVIQLPVEITSPYRDTDTAPRLSGTGVTLSEPKEQAFTLSTAKINMADGSKTVNMLFNVGSETDHANHTFDIGFAVNEIEYQIQDPDVDRYQVSSWLSFVLPLKLADFPQFDLGEVTVPVPLRAYPQIPIAVDQIAKATIQPITDLAYTKEWHYTFSFSTETADQDTVYLQFMRNFGNVQIPSRIREEADRFFDALAQFIAVSQPISKALLELPTATSFSPALIETVNTLADLIVNVASSWGYYEAFTFPTALLSPGSTDDYRLQSIVNESNQIERLKLILVSSAGKLAIFPNLARVTADGTLCPLQVISTSSHERIYQLATPCLNDDPDPCKHCVLADEPLLLQATFAGLDVTAVQNIFGGLYLTRNEQLNEQQTTEPPFVFQTPLVTLANPIVPALVYQEPLSIQATPDQSLTEALNEMFQALLGSPPQPLSMQLSAEYQYELTLAVTSPVNDPIVSTLPITYNPQFMFATSTEQAEFVNTVVSIIDKWQTANAPSTAGGKYQFGLTLYSTIGPVKRPLLTLSKLIYNAFEI